MSFQSFIAPKRSVPNKCSDKVPFVHEIQLQRCFHHSPWGAEEHVTIKHNGIRLSTMHASTVRSCLHDKWTSWKLAGKMASFLATRSNPVKGLGVIPFKRAIERLFPVKKT
jgi:hypothetical protein